jgi:hypothetical protein
MFQFFRKKKKPDPDASFREPLSPEADRFLAEACAEYEGKRDALLTGEWRLTSCQDWDFDIPQALVTVKFADGSEWQADGQFLGSYSFDDQTFQWAWDSPDMDDHLKRDSQLVKEAGERFNIRYLLLGGGCFPLPRPEFVDYLCAIGLKATGSAGVMEAPAENMAGFIMLKNLRWTKALA